MSDKNIKVGDEVFSTSNHLQRGTVVAIKTTSNHEPYGFDVKVRDEIVFFSEVYTYKKEEAYRECVDMSEYWQRRADELLSELDADEEAEEQAVEA
jgi:hypothetical protein